jgi:hypothetical protein
MADEEGEDAWMRLSLGFSLSRKRDVKAIEICMWLKATESFC